MIFLILLIIIFNILLYLLKNQYAKLLNIYDEPDNVRKKHQFATTHWWKSYIF